MNAAQCTTHKRPAWVPQKRFPFESRFVEIDGNCVHYVDEGQGPTLLLLHGNPTWSFLYREIIVRLRHRFRCVALDYPGFGLSQAGDGYDYLPASHARVVDRFIDALALAEFAVMVQDWGGPIGLWCAARRPDAVRGLIIGNTWAWPVDGDRHFERFSKMMGGRVGRFAIRHFNAFVNVLIPLMVRTRKVERDVMQAYRKPFAIKDARAATAIFPREIVHSSAFLGEVKAGLVNLAAKPALILWGLRDIAFREHERKQFEDLFVDHHTVLLARAGHYIQEDAPLEIANEIEKWWDRC